MKYDNIIVSNEDGITTITLNRPQKLNALDANILLELVQAIEEARADRAQVLALIKYIKAATTHRPGGYQVPADVAHALNAGRRDRSVAVCRGRRSSLNSSCQALCRFRIERWPGHPESDRAKMLDPGR